MRKSSKLVNQEYNNLKYFIILLTKFWCVGVTKFLFYVHAKTIWIRRNMWCSIFMKIEPANFFLKIFFPCFHPASSFDPNLDHPRFVGWEKNLETVANLEIFISWDPRNPKKLNVWDFVTMIITELFSSGIFQIIIKIFD